MTSFDYQKDIPATIRSWATRLKGFYRDFKKLEESHTETLESHASNLDILNAFQVVVDPNNLDLEIKTWSPTITPNAGTYTTSIKNFYYGNIGKFLFINFRVVGTLSSTPTYLTVSQPSDFNIDTSWITIGGSQIQNPSSFDIGVINPTSGGFRLYNRTSTAFTVGNLDIRGYGLLLVT